MIKQEIKTFLIVGSLTVLTDFLTYQLLLLSSLLSIDTAKGLSFLTGTLFAYVTNRFWTFAHRQPARGSILRFAVLYTFTLYVNVVVNSTMLNVFSEFRWHIQAAFIIATGLTATLNFIGMKWFTFKEHIPSESL